VYVVCVTVHVKQEHIGDFIEATLENARNTRKEPGNVRFDVLQAIEPETQFLLYEAYRTPDDFTAHQQTAHYLAWRSAVADWMAEPRQGVRLKSLFPEPWE
jgi:(4S)-4-hydroxy-5-phosphonooxypentane-2,3-dione isomerase